MIWQKNQKIYTTDELSRDLKYYMVITLEVPTAISLKVKDSNYWKKKKKTRSYSSIIKLLVRLGWPTTCGSKDIKCIQRLQPCKNTFRGVKCAKSILKCELENECNS
jgi:hypothetical protein